MAQPRSAAKKATPAKTTPAAKAAKAIKAARPKAPTKPVAAKKADKADKAAAKSTEARKVKLVRDSFTIPKAEYATLDGLKERATQAGLPGKKSEVLRAGIMALAAMDDAAFRAAMGAVPTLKTGRPKQG
ncbi:MAG: hypothetical protein H0U68_05595 [Ramlibacter sp.]|nr:hypothetical protein [Ramlibacter sp.]MBA2673143.1 hypothetical protein [Ramlibacter sp.]